MIQERAMAGLIFKAFVNKEKIMKEHAQKLNIETIAVIAYVILVKIIKSFGSSF